MQQLPMVVLASLVAVAVFTSGRLTADDPKRTEHKLVGTWKMVKAKYDGKEVKLSEEKTEFKHVTPTHFMIAAVVVKEGKVITTFGGPYTLTGEKYVETPEYGFGSTFTDTGVKGKPQSFTWKVEGNKWYHTGTLTNGLTIEEVWERVEPK